MATRESFWARRLRWRLIGAWRWPLFIVITFADAAIVAALPPTGARALFFPALFICSFANLFLIGAVAPWLAHRIQARQGERPAPSQFPPADHREVLIDRIASVTLVVGMLGLVAAGLGNRKVVVADTNRLAHAAAAVQAYVDARGTAEVKRNLDTLNTHPLQEDGLFRMCVALDDRTKAFCMYVDAKKNPPTVRPDGDSRPNGLYFHGS